MDVLHMQMLEQMSNRIRDTKLTSQALFILSRGPRQTFEKRFRGKLPDIIALAMLADVEEDWLHNCQTLQLPTDGLCYSVISGNSELFLCIALEPSFATNA